MYLFIIYLLCLKYVESTQNITDLSKCKLSHLGLDFIGEISKTESGVRCQSWTSSKPVHEMDSSIVDEMFPRKSKALANNYCRNPKRKEDGPWCYTMDKQLIDETCGIPLCSFPECKITGPGMEYGGTHKKATSDKNCLKWDKHRKRVKNNIGDYYEQEKFSKRKFPDDSRGDAENYCRNPDGDPGGPWCFVDAGKGVEKQYCNIPFCHEEDCVTFTQDSKSYTHYTLINGSITNLTFGIKIWSPDNLQPTARLLLSLFALPLNGDEIDELNIGIEIFISNKESAMTVGNKDKPDYEPTISILKSYTFTYFSLTWTSGFVTLEVQGQKNPIFLSEYKWKRGLFGQNRNKFFYYSILGTNVLWSLPFCDEEDSCEVHTTTSAQFERFWPLHHTNSSYDLNLFVRAFHSAIILFQPSPTVLFPRIKLTLGNEKDNTTKIVLYEYEGAAEFELKRTVVLKILNFWNWGQFTVTFFGEAMQVYWNKEVGTLLVIEVNHPKISGMRWFSPGSEDSVAIWTFFCSAGDLAAPPPPWPPECVLSHDEVNYKGTQSVTYLGHPCMPWTHNSETETRIGKEQTLENWNYCRDPLDERQGTFCYVVNQKSETKFEKEKCVLRLCRSSECRMAGTGNDYIGKLNTTRSNRTCQYWTSNTPHLINKTHLNSSLYADQDIKLAENYCRNPTRNLAGSWCYTTDKEVVRDVCNIRDCVHNEECIIVTRGNGAGRSIYILPEWKERGLYGGLRFALKEWNPDFLDGILFEITPLDDKPGFIKLVIGAENNEKVLVYYSKTDKNYAKLVKEKTLPHLIPTGSWAAFWLQIRRGEIMLGYEGTLDPLFVWEHDNKNEAFEPGFMSYMSIQGNYIGVHFKCTECHTERTVTKYVTRIMPLRLWYTEETTDYTSLSVYARGTGVLLIPLLLLPGEGLDYYAFAIGDLGTYIIFLLNLKKSTELLAHTQRKQVLKPDIWTHYYFTFSEHNIEVFRDNESVLTYHSEKNLLFYWFSITVEKGWITWAANCDPPDIDGAPRDGGWSQWSPWQCTVSCGGGTGVRTRTCSNPKPNIRGKLCEGAHSDTGVCNDFKCGDLSPDTMEKIRERLRTTQSSIIINEDNQLVIENDNELLELINKESPKASFQWTLNGVYLKAEDGIKEFVNNGIVTYSAKYKRDSGIYVCVLYRIGGERLIFRVVTVAIITEQYNIVTRATLEMDLICNSAILAYVYTDLSQAWLLNDEIYIDYGITTLAAVVTERIGPLSLNHTGNWACRVTQNDLGLNWIVNIVQVKVKTSPNWITHLMEDQFTAPIFGKFESETSVVILLVFLIILIFALVFVGLYLYLKYGTLPQRKYKRIKRHK